MRARMNRKILLSYLKSMVRVVPQSNSIMELMGFMIECNEDEGVVYITVSNLETTIQRKFNASIEEGGSFVVAARMFLGIVDRLLGSGPHIVCIIIDSYHMPGLLHHIVIAFLIAFA